MRTQFPVTDTSTVSTARATSTGCFFVSNKSNKTSTDAAKILPSCRTQPLSFAFQLEPYIPDFQGAKTFLKPWEFLWFPQLTGSNTNIIIQRLKAIPYKDFASKLLSYRARFHPDFHLVG